MWELLRISAQWVNIAICIAGIGVAYMWVCDWLIGKLCRYIKSYWFIIDYALNYKLFKVWKAEQRKTK